MSEERKKVLEMLAAGKITAEEAERLLDKLGSASSSQAAEPKGSSASASPGGSAKPRFLRIVVDAPGREQVNMRVPLSFVGTGSRLLAVMPRRLSERLAEFGLDPEIFAAANSEEFHQAVRDINIDVEKGNGKKVRIYCE